MMGFDVLMYCSMDAVNSVTLGACRSSPASLAARLSAGA
jgi:hypothetical protein